MATQARPAQSGVATFDGRRGPCPVVSSRLSVSRLGPPVPAVSRTELKGKKGLLVHGPGRDRPCPRKSSDGRFCQCPVRREMFRRHGK